MIGEEFVREGYTRLSAAIVSSAVIEYKATQERLQQEEKRSYPCESTIKSHKHNMEVIKKQMLAKDNPVVLYLETMGHEVTDQLIKVFSSEDTHLNKSSMRSKYRKKDKSDATI